MESRFLVLATTFRVMFFSQDWVFSVVRWNTQDQVAQSNSQRVTWSCAIVKLGQIFHLSPTCFLSLLSAVWASRSPTLCFLCEFCLIQSSPGERCFFWLILRDQSPTLQLIHTMRWMPSFLHFMCQN